MAQSQNDIVRLQIIYRAMLLGQVIFLGIVFFIQQQGVIDKVPETINRVLQVAVIVLGAAGVVTGHRMYKAKVTAINNSNATVEEKLKQYTTPMLIRCALTEFPVLLSGISYMLTGNTAFLLAAGVLVFIFAGYHPAKQKLLTELNISPGE
jgi:hypothetical protein